MISSGALGTLYVSQAWGSDTFSGFCPERREDYQGPLKTIEAALERIRTLRAAGQRQPVSIVITDRIYFLDKPAEIDSSLELITIRGLSETVVSGGFRVTGFVWDTFNGHRCLRARIPQVQEGLWFTDFYVDGQRADLTALPRDGYFSAKQVEDESERYDAESRWFIPEAQELEHFRNLRNMEDCQISFYHFWVDEHTPIESCDFETGRITMKYRSRFSIGAANPNAKMRWRLENTAEAFAHPNEWYLDRQTSNLYYIPRTPEQTPESIEAYLPLTGQLFCVRGTPERPVEHITFRNLTFSHTRGDYSSRIRTDSLEMIGPEEMGYACDEQGMCSAYGALKFCYARSCAVEHCRLENLGLHGITINGGCSGIRIFGNRFFRLGGGGIKVCGGAYGCPKSEETWGNVISQNSITQCGQRYYASVGVMIMHSYGNTVSHNEIGELSYTGISCGWVWGYGNSITRDNLIEKNHVHHIGHGHLSDMGAIYLLGVQPGTVVRNNVVHDVMGYRYGGTGIYTDEGSAYILVEKNIVYNIHTAAFNHHFGRMNTVRNNIFAKAGKIMQASRPELHTGVLSEQNILVSEGRPAYGFGYKQEGPCCGNVQMIGGSRNLHFDMEGDYCLFDMDGKRYSLEEAQKTFGVEWCSVYADPKFLDYDGNDFCLAEDSPAYALGFEEIDTSDVGITL